MYKKNFTGWLKHIDFLILDLLCLQFAYFLAYNIRFDKSNAFLQNPYSETIYLHLAGILLFIDILLFLTLNPFKNVVKRGLYKEFTATVKNTLFVFLLLTVYLFFTKTGSNYSRYLIVLSAGIYALSSYGARILWKNLLKDKSLPGYVHSLLIVSTCEKLKSGDIYSAIDKDNLRYFKLKGVALLDTNLIGKKVAGKKVVADKNSLIDYVRNEWVDEVFISSLPDEYNTKDYIQDFLDMGVVVHQELVNMNEFVDRNEFVERMGSYTVLTASINSVSPIEAFLKRVMDILGGLVGCLITGILYIFLAPLIKKESPGPVFFSQERIGRNGKKFKMYKFRSMYLDAEERKKELMAENRVGSGMMFKLDWDPRIIGAKKLPDGTTKKGIGNIIRDWSLDEFPQFFNVLKGDMSLVGTRPPTLDEWEKYENHHRARMSVKPGVTGMWQVSGRSNITDFEEVVALDRKYIANWSLALDIKILFKTFVVVFKKEGSM